MDLVPVVDLPLPSVRGAILCLPCDSLASSTTQGSTVSTCVFFSRCFSTGSSCGRGRQGPRLYQIWGLILHTGEGGSDPATRTVGMKLLWLSGIMPFPEPGWSGLLPLPPQGFYPSIPLWAPPAPPSPCHPQLHGGGLKGRSLYFFVFLLGRGG